MERISGQGARRRPPRAASADGGRRRTNPSIAARAASTPRSIEEIKKRFGFDKPLLVRYVEMLWRYIGFDFGDSLFQGSSVMGLITERLPVSISLGLWSTLIIYLVSIPLGIRKAVRHGSRFDVWTSSAMVVGNTIPTFLFAIILIIFFAGGSLPQDLPAARAHLHRLRLAGPLREDRRLLLAHRPARPRRGDRRLRHPHDAHQELLPRRDPQAVRDDRAGQGPHGEGILRKHVFRNAMLLVIAGFPATFISMFFTGSVLIEVIFSLNGLGLLGFEATMQRDYPVMFGTLYIFTLLGLLLGLLSDLTYTLVDPRIDFETRQT